MFWSIFFSNVMLTDVRHSMLIKLLKPPIKDYAVISLLKLGQLIYY